MHHHQCIKHPLKTLRKSAPKSLGYLENFDGKWCVEGGDVRQRREKGKGGDNYVKFASMKCSGTESEKQDTSSRSGNDAEADDADIREKQDRVPSE
ncbi:hypothetical protein Tco_1525182 [Tanacetum coccineum]